MSSIMRKVMVFQHVAHEPLGTLNPLLKDAGFRVRYINFGRDPFLEPNVDDYNGLIVLGGPMGVYEANQYPHLHWEMKQIEKAIKKEIPVLGICLGAQLISQVLGSPVRKGPKWEFGWTEIETTEHAKSDPVFSNYKSKETLFQIHGDTFDIPKDAVQLARSKMYPGQAFRYGEKTYGLQYHLEADQAMITRWMKRNEHMDFVHNSNGEFSMEQIEADTQKNIEASLKLSSDSFQKFINLFGLTDRPELLGSR